MPRRRERPPHELLKTVRLPCADCGQPLSVQVQAFGNPYGATYLCPACLDARVAQVQATPKPPVRPGRGRTKKVRG